MRWENLTQLKSYSKLKEAARVDVPAVMSGESGAERVKGYDIPMGGGLEFNYAARPVSEEILDILQELSDEQELGAKYEALYNGERVNTGENRMVLHQLCRGQLGNEARLWLCRHEGLILRGCPETEGRWCYRCNVLFRCANPECAAGTGLLQEKQIELN